MPHIALPEGLPGIASAFAYRPATAAPMRALAEVLLRGPSTLTSGEREMIAAFVSTCALLNFYNRWITASGVPEMSPESHALQGKTLASRGYVRD